MALKFAEYGSDRGNYKPTGVWIGCDDGNNQRAVKIIHADGSETTRTFEDSTLLGPLLYRALEIQRTNAPLSEF